MKKTKIFQNFRFLPTVKYWDEFFSKFYLSNFPKGVHRVLRVQLRLIYSTINWVQIVATFLGSKWLHFIRDRLHFYMISFFQNGYILVSDQKTRQLSIVDYRKKWFLILFALFSVCSICIFNISSNKYDVKCCTLGTRGKTQIAQKNVSHWGKCCTLGGCTLGATGVFQLFKLGAYIDMVYVRSYNVRYMKIYSAEICAYIDICLIENTWFALVLKINFSLLHNLKFLRGHDR